ncbi:MULTISPECIES: VanZ family protein [Listeria]|uniref:VanZ family protein n=1 Tax=Listeria TaxID=1637 RepID=UPI000B58A62D|nr:MULTISPECIES: VanZ family protein [Listeria]
MGIYFEELGTYLTFFCIYMVSIIILKLCWKKSWGFLLCYSIFYLYITEVIRITQFPLYFIDRAEQNLSIWQGVSLVPFVSIDPKGYLLNTLLTIPFGFGLPFLLRMSWKRMMIVGFTFTLLIEVTQFLIGYRIADIDDIIFNFLGSMIGYALFKGLKFVLLKLFRGDTEKMPAIFD